MPKKGYKSITVKQDVYDYFYNEWSKVKEEYVIRKGVRSFSAYVSMRLVELANQETKSKFKMINHDARGVKIFDSELQRVADIQITPRGIYCPICDAYYCDHVRFALSQEDVRDSVRKRRKEGWKLPEV